MTPFASPAAAAFSSSGALPTALRRSKRCSAPALPGSLPRAGVLGLKVGNQRGRRRPLLPLRCPDHLDITSSSPVVALASASASASAPLPLLSSSSDAAITLISSESSPKKQKEKQPSLISRFVSWWSLDDGGGAEAAAASSDAASSSARSTSTAADPRPLATLVARLWQLMNPHPLLLGGAILLLIAAAAAELSVPHLTSAAIASAAGGMADSLRGDVRRLALAAVAYGCFTAMRGFLFSLLNTELVQNLRTALFSALVRAPPEAYDDPDGAGSAASRLGADCYAVARCVSTNLNIAARNALAATGGAVYLARASPEAAKACAGVGVALAAAALVYGRYSRAASRAAQDRLADAAATAEEALARATTVRALGGEGAEEQRYATALARLQRVARRQSASYLAYVASNASLFNLSKAAALAAAGAVALRGELSARTLTAVLLYVDATASAALSLADQWGAVMEALGAAERVLAYVDAPRAPQLEPRATRGDVGAGIESESERSRGGGGGGDGKNQSPRRPGIVPGPRLSTVELRDVRYTYPNRSGAPALDGVRLVLTKGRRVALVGGSGSGKSTLVQLVLRLRDPDPENGGAVLLNGYDAREVCARWRSSRMALVEQEPRLFTDTVERNIAYGCRIVEDEESEERRSASSSLWSSPTSTSTSSASDSSILFSFGGDSSPAAPSFSSSSFSSTRPTVNRAQIVSAAQAANAHDFISALPNGYETRVTDRLLSGGQRQRLALARALVRNPDVLILDESTSALDAESEEKVQAGLDAAMADGSRATLIIAHRLSTVRSADEILVMRKGRVAERGTHAALMASKGEYFSLVSKQSGGLEGGDLAPHQREAGAAAVAAVAAAVAAAAAAAAGEGDDAAAAAAVAAAAAAVGGSSSSSSSSSSAASPKAAPRDDDDNDGVVSPTGGGSDLLPAGSGAPLDNKAKR